MPTKRTGSGRGGRGTTLDDAWTVKHTESQVNQDGLTQKDGIGSFKASHDTLQFQGTVTSIRNQLYTTSSIVVVAPRIERRRSTKRKARASAHEGKATNEEEFGVRAVMMHLLGSPKLAKRCGRTEPKKGCWRDTSWS
jgi:hypothetical protein